MGPRRHYGITALRQARVAELAIADIESFASARPELWRALLAAALRDQAMLRTWLEGFGSRDAAARVAHLVCEIHARLEHAGLAANGQFEFPLTQEVLGQALGLTAVHVNRVLQRLRTEGLFSLTRGRMAILDYDGLAGLAGFRPNYLG